MSVGDFVSMGLVCLSTQLSRPRCCYLGMNEALFLSSMEAQSAILLSPAAAQKPTRYVWQINSFCFISAGVFFCVCVNLSLLQQIHMYTNNHSLYRSVKHSIRHMYTWMFLSKREKNCLKPRDANGMMVGVQQGKEL